MTTRVKVCGMTNSKDALKAAALGAWAVGFIFYKKSPRFIGAYKAQRIISQLPPFVTPVGVFVNQKEGAVKEIADFCGIRTLQFHGDEEPSYLQRFKKYKLIKAIRVNEKIKAKDLMQYPVSAFLFDSFVEDKYGGSGKSFDWSWIKSAKGYGVPSILSGGLNSQNVKSAIEAVSPYAVDVCSAVESSPGKKDERALSLFLDSAAM